MFLPRLAIACTLGILVIAGVVHSAVSGPSPPSASLREDAVTHLRELIRIDTSSPPGHETRAAQYLKSILERAGIPAELLALEPQRANLVARVRGSGRKRPVIIMGHTDVVGVERDRWSVDPFAGEVRDGMIWGRGAVDDKDTVAAGLAAVLAIHRERVALDRDIIFIAEAGEEGMPQVGINFLVDRHWHRIDAEYALAEGGTVVDDGPIQYFGVATSEKLPRALRLVARGTAGHGSVPRADNPIVRLATAVAKIGAWQPPMRLTETTREYFRRLAVISPPQDAFLFANVGDPVTGPIVQERFRQGSSRYHSMLRTSISPNVIRGGFRTNVIPATAETVLDVRLLPGDDIDPLVDQLARVIDDPAVEIRREPHARPPSPASRIDTEMFRVIASVQQAMYPEATTVPMMLTGATDMAQLRAKGVQAYGLGGAEIPGSSLAHGHDERIGVEALGDYAEFIYRTLVGIAAAKGQEERVRSSRGPLPRTLGR